ncbi:MAG: hypothetical protein CL959_04580 [Euryarchaeota archaeon]|jgi:hypothetical protein|nr:hypothetical protein [Euryarchaeota archaeon]|tara:strand:- start:1021 stop:1263 length:243 start_codon:yes stop_codon:yes gene_type:complete
MSDYPKTHVVEVHHPKGMPMQIKGLFYKGTLKWMSLNVLSSDGEESVCEVPEDKDEVFDKMRELLHRVFITSEKMGRKSR